MVQGFHEAARCHVCGSWCGSLVCEGVRGDSLLLQLMTLPSWYFISRVSQEVYAGLLRGLLGQKI